MHKSSNFLWSCFHAKIREIELLCNFLFLVFHRKFVKLIFATSLKLFSRKNREIAFCRLSWIWFHEKIRESKWFQLFLKFFSRKNREITFLQLSFNLISRKSESNHFFSCFHRKKSWSCVFFFFFNCPWFWYS